PSRGPECLPGSAGWWLRPLRQPDAEPRPGAGSRGRGDAVPRLGTGGDRILAVLLYRALPPGAGGPRGLSRPAGHVPPGFHGMGEPRPGHALPGRTALRALLVGGSLGSSGAIRTHLEALAGRPFPPGPSD